MQTVIRSFAYSNGCSIIIEMRDVHIKGGWHIKRMNSKLGRKFRAIVAMFSLVDVLLAGAQSYPVSAAENQQFIEDDGASSENSKMNVQTFEFEVGPEDTTNSTNSTTYFINDQEFSFTGYNLGYEFYVPRMCNCRMMVAVVAADKKSEDITINIRYSGGGVTHSQKVATNKAGIYIFNNVGGGGHNLEYIGRDNTRYTIRISLYTWDY